MKKILCLTIVLVFSLGLLSGCSTSEKKIVVGAKDFTEQDILGNILTTLLESNTDLVVEYKHEMSSNVVFAAIQSGDIDVYIDYTGTIYGNYLSYSDIKSADEVRDIVVKETAEKYQLQVLDPLGFNNTYTLAVRPETANAYNLKTYSDLAGVSSELALGGTFEILNRNDGIPNLKIVYDMAFSKEVALDGTLRYSAIAEDEVQVIDAFSTDGMLMEYELVVLEDDKNFFPPYHAVPVLRQDTSEKYPEIASELKKLADFISDDVMRELNYQVDVLKKNPTDVATEFLKSSGLVD